MIIIYNISCCNGFLCIYYCIAKQLSALLPVYLLQLCSGLNTGFPAVLTAQLREGCSEDGFVITRDQESWIGKYYSIQSSSV